MKPNYRKRPWWAFVLYCFWRVSVVLPWFVFTTWWLITGAKMNEEKLFFASTRWGFIKSEWCGFRDICSYRAGYWSWDEMLSHSVSEHRQREQETKL